ncbi:MAG: PEP-CTERM sorting domain-containing protein [Verrucomicrobia bacterium]|nr:PEP-CTERM sorting domain-containing protein [Verrucomicrobiota bacterium]
MKSVVQVGSGRKVILGTAGAVVALLAPQALGVVTFEFRDVAPVGNPNGVDNVPAGGTFTFAVVVHATEEEQLLGLTFKPEFLEWTGPGGPTFTIDVEPDRSGSFFNDPGVPTVKGQRLQPDTAGELGAENLAFGTTTGPNLFVANITLRVDATMPPGDYVIGSSDVWARWYGPDYEAQEFASFTPYSVNVVVPEPSAVGLLGALGLLGFGVYRRLRN